MALLGSCWFIIEEFIIPDGFLKWFYLSFYIHPFFLLFCQIYLWVKFLQRWFLFIVSLPFRITCFVVSCLLRFLRRHVISLCSFTRFNTSTKVEDEYAIPQIADSHSCWNTGSMKYEVNNIYELQTRCFELETSYKVGSVLHVDETTEESNVDAEEEEDTSFNSSICSSISSATDVEMMNGDLPSVCSSNSPVMGQESTDESDEKESIDSFYKKYTERMRWFDILNDDRKCGISAILNKQLASHSSFESIQPLDFSIPHISWSKMARKRLLRSLESDFERLYVAQSCLSWEALHSQYQKVEIACYTSQNDVFYNNIAGKFQKFQVLLERFMEDERCEGKRYWNYAQRRSSLKSLLQVPEVSGYIEEEKEGTKGEATRATEVLKAIEKCIKAFWLYVKTDNKKPCWKVRSRLWTYPPLEDPRDLKLLSEVTKTLHKKELWLKDLEGKKKCWLKRVVNPLGESQKKEILFTMIDMKLVSRVLKMSIISTCQLKWCQEKCDNIEFKEGKVMRACMGPLFPST